jgi:DGQHR domain-containing protein
MSIRSAATSTLRAPLLPNALTIAFDERVSFTALDVPAPVPYARYGTLSIPVDDAQPGHARPGWLVDGQQRSAAIREAARSSMPIGVAAFIDPDPARQREQFIRVNATQPLSRGLLYELLPITAGPLPAALERRRLPARLAERLNHDPASRLCLMIRTPTNPGGLIKDNSILRALGNSLTNGALYPYAGCDGQTHDIAGMVEATSNFWAAVRDVPGRLGAAAAPVPAAARRWRHRPRLPDGRDRRRPRDAAAGPAGLRRGPDQSGGRLPVDRRGLGVRPPLERGPEHHP